MRRYETSMSRTSFGLAAIAMTVVTFALTVALPAHFYSERVNDATATLARSASSKPIEVALIPSRIDVTGQCEQAMAYEPPRRVHTVNDRES
ncbi:MAG TPA: hypothetical protein VMU96_03750 [Casimicrobiaceae bacterium]|nr:hypothetical protein [Casimicrobiaceae bacterium]